MSKPEDFKFDSRVRERLLRGRTLSTADLKRHIDALPDLEGEYELLNDTPQPAVTPARDHHAEEPLVFDGIRRLQALSEPHSGPRPSPVAPVSLSSGLPAREPPRSLGSMDASRGAGPALRSALMESEISGVGAGAVSAALGAMAAEARSAAGFPPAEARNFPPAEARNVGGFPPVVPMAPQITPEEPQTPLTLRSQAAPENLETPESVKVPEPVVEEEPKSVADWEAPYPESEDMT
jgi:hypothetical protein